MTACTFCPHHCPPPPPKGVRTCPVCGAALIGQRKRLCGSGKCDYEDKKAALGWRKHLVGPNGTRCGRDVPLSRLAAPGEAVDCELCLRVAKPPKASPERTHLCVDGRATLCGFLAARMSLVEGTARPTCQLCLKRWRARR